MLGSNLHAKRRKLMQGQGNAPPQQPQQSPAFGLFSQAFEKPKMTLGDKLGMLGGRLMDMDGTLGSGNYAMAKDAYDTRVSEARDEFGQNQQRQLMMMAAQGDPMALFMLDPNAALAEKRDARNFGYQKTRDAVTDDRWQQGFQREGDWRMQDVQYRDDRATRQDFVDDRNYERGVIEGDRGYNLNERRFAWDQSDDNPANAAKAENFGLAPIYGEDEKGNPVIMQTNKSGGLALAPTPEGVTLTGDPRSAAYNRALGTEEGKRAAYRTQEGMKVVAAEEAFNRVSAQIDDAIKTSNGYNTGLVGGKLPAPNLQGLLDTIGANVAFDALVDLKSQGGTLGALSDTELNLLKAKVANVERSQSEEQLDANLEILRMAMQSSMMKIKRQYEDLYAQGAYRSAGAGTSANRRVGPSGQPVPEGFE